MKRTFLPAWQALLPLIVLPLALSGRPAWGAGPQSLEPLQTVPSVDLGRFQGTWYQIAYYPNPFQGECVSDTTAQYQLEEGGGLRVTNRCRTGKGKLAQAVGEARLRQLRFLGLPVSSPHSTARLEVRFAPSWLSWLPAVWGDYWVIQLASDYRYAVVGEPTRSYLWVLSRTPALDPQDRLEIRQQLVQQGYDPALLRDEVQTAAVARPGSSTASLGGPGGAAAITGAPSSGGAGPSATTGAAPVAPTAGGADLQAAPER